MALWETPYLHPAPLAMETSVSALPVRSLGPFRVLLAVGHHDRLVPIKEEEEVRELVGIHHPHIMRNWVINLKSTSTPKTTSGPQL
jgi:hypothetical protein